jgi:hypothetical protein
LPWVEDAPVRIAWRHRLPGRARLVTSAVLLVLVAGGTAAWWISPNGPSARGVFRIHSCPDRPDFHAGGGFRPGKDLHIVPVLPVPNGPVRTTVCRYRAARPSLSAFRLVGSARLDASRTAELAGWLDYTQGPRWDAACGPSPLNLDVLTFAYPDGPDVGVLLGVATGCGSVTNGTTEATASQTLIRGLDELVPTKA